MEEKTELFGGYAICLNQWALDKDIKNELGLLLIISSLCAKEGYCWASNKYLADIYNEGEQSISNKIKKLKDKGYIDIEYTKRGCEVVERKITLRYNKNYIDDITNVIPTVKQMTKDNNISINNININNNIYSEVVDYLNQKVGTKYRSNTGKTKSLIKARINEGFTEDDFKTVIDKKCEEWLNTDMSKYLRPETLFGTHFESYLNQGNISKSIRDSNKDFFERKRKEIEEEQNE